MPVLWDSKVTFASVSQFWGLALCSPFGSVSGPCVTPHLIVSLGKRKKKGGKRKRNGKKNKPSADFKPVQQVLLVFLYPTGIGGMGFTFLPSSGFERLGTRSGSQYSQFPSLRSRSSVSCQAQISHSASGCAVQDKFRCQVPLRHSASGHVQLNHSWGEPATAQEFLTKQLPAVLNKCTAFHTAQLSNQSGDYPSQGLTQPNSSLLQMFPGTSISLVLASTVPADVYRLRVSPTLSLFPPDTSSLQVPPGAGCPPCSGRGGS